MTIEQLHKQSERMEGFKEGFQACLQWVAANLEAEKRAEDAEKDACVAKA